MRASRGPRPIGRALGVDRRVRRAAVVVGRHRVRRFDHERLVVPAEWDTKVAPIAAEVARLRGLEFVHPVPIQYLAATAFEKELGGDGRRQRRGRAAVRHEEEVFRALGFIGGKVDLVAAFDTSQASGTLAYLRRVRAGHLRARHDARRRAPRHDRARADPRAPGPALRSAKLQKQATDSDTGDSAALKALVEGDAVRIEDDYLEQLSDADQNEYDARERGRGPTGRARRPRRFRTSSGCSSARRTRSAASTVEAARRPRRECRRSTTRSPGPRRRPVLHRSRVVEPSVAVDAPLLPRGRGCRGPGGVVRRLRDVPHARDAARSRAARSRRPTSSSAGRRSPSAAAASRVTGSPSPRPRSTVACSWPTRSRTGRTGGDDKCRRGRRPRRVHRLRPRNPRARSVDARFEAAVALLKIRMALTVGSAKNDH